jgi:predicted DNA-binding transcriptional regulator AlpA
VAIGLLGGLHPFLKFNTPRFAKGSTKRRESKFRRKSLLNKDGSIKKRMLGVKELAVYLGLKAQTIYNKVSAGTFPIKHRRIGRLLKWDVEDINFYLDSLPANY